MITKLKKQHIGKKIDDDQDGKGKEDNLFYFICDKRGHNDDGCWELHPEIVPDWLGEKVARQKVRKPCTAHLKSF